MSVSQPVGHDVSLKYGIILN